MVLPNDEIQKILQLCQREKIKHSFAQVDARSILQEVNEAPENYPRFEEELTDKVTVLAYSLLAAGVSLAEKNQRQDAARPLEEAASILKKAHIYDASSDAGSSFHILIAAMAFYASGQYSQAFVTISKAIPRTDIAKMIAAFLRKRPHDLILASNPYLLANLAEFDDYDNICEHAVTVVIARVMSLVLEYWAMGGRHHLVSADSLLDTAMSLTIDFRSPSLWWIIRLLKLIVYDAGSSSLWTLLPPYFPEGSLLLNRYIQLLLFNKYPVTELWYSQQQALPITMDGGKTGAIVNMRTSAGKTRVAELAILQTLQNNNFAKVLYIAPFRSLAFEMEQTFSQTFSRLGFNVSHLYGGLQINAADRQLSKEANIIIATPEKIRAILRGAPELLSEIKLIIVDEGHLIGVNERFIRNELFLDHLRCVAGLLECKIIMLSAVLPNPEHLSEWLTDSADNVVKSHWKPSYERFGILRWQGNGVRIDWRGEIESFNPRFVQPMPLGWGRRRNPFPYDKNEAIAATAVRLAQNGTVMIFSARANSIQGLAEKVLIALGESPECHPWPGIPWKIFQTICEEELADDAIELKAARCGVICHSNRLPTQVRIATERLMRSFPPKIIIASTTLGQGVNIGISTVIVASPYYNNEPINHRDFWNICGRAGRAFVDGEGKILYAIDEEILSVPNNVSEEKRRKIVSDNYKKKEKIRKEYRLADYYFNPDNLVKVESGLLYVIARINQIAEKNGVNFELLLGMIVEDDFSKFGEDTGLCCYIMDLIDDGLLAFYEAFQNDPQEFPPDEWVDLVMRKSLAAIQSEISSKNLSKEQFLQVIKTRLKALIRRYPNSSQRKTYVAMGIPLSSAQNVFRDKDIFIEKIRELQQAETAPSAVIGFLQWLEEWARENARSVVEELPPKEIMDVYRSGWIMGTPIQKICDVDNDSLKIFKDIYGYSIPWLINAIVQLLRKHSLEEDADFLSDIGALVELGVPSMTAAMIFLAGISSRAAATELSTLGIDLGNTVSAIKQSLRDANVIDYLQQIVSEKTGIWLELHQDIINQTEKTPQSFPLFQCKNVDEYTSDLIVRSDGGQIYLCTPDGATCIPVSTEKLPFDEIANDYRYSFQRRSGVFHLITRDVSNICE